MPVRHTMNFQNLSLRPSFFKLTGQFNNLTGKRDQFPGAVLQLIEQSHRLFLGEMTTEFLDNLVVVVANHSVLRVKRRKLGVVFHQRLVLTQHLERLAEDACLGKNSLRLHVSLLVHDEEFHPFVIVEPKHDVVRLRVQLGDSSPSFSFCVHIKWIKWYMRQ